MKEGDEKGTGLQATGLQLLQAVAGDRGPVTLQEDCVLATSSRYQQKSAETQASCQNTASSHCLLGI